MTISKKLYSGVAASIFATILLGATAIRNVAKMGDDIDGLVRLKGKNLHAGDLVSAKVTAADGYDLAARAMGSAR